MAQRWLFLKLKNKKVDMLQQRPTLRPLSWYAILRATFRTRVHNYDNTTPDTCHVKPFARYVYQIEQNLPLEGWSFCTGCGKSCSSQVVFGKVMCRLHKSLQLKSCGYVNETTVQEWLVLETSYKCSTGSLFYFNDCLCLSFHSKTSRSRTVVSLTRRCVGAVKIIELGF